MDWQVILNYLAQLATSWGIKLLEALVLLVVGLKLIKWVKKWLKTSPKMEKLDSGLRSFLCSFSSIVLYALLIIVVASILGIPATSFITILASCGVAVGLALQGSLSNFAGGLMILFFKPFKVGDFIEASGESGVVQEITVVYTVLLTPDNKRVTIPNGGLTNSVIENYSTEELRRVDLEFKVAYTSDIEQVKSLITALTNAHPLVLKAPAPFVRLSAQGDSALVFTARAWCKNEDYWAVYFDLNEGVKKAFDDKGIQIPYPQMDVHVKN